MSTTTAALTIAVLLAVSLAGAYLLVLRAERRTSWDRAARHLHHHDDGDGLEALYALPAYNPDMAAGLNRLHNTIHDDTEGGTS